MKQPVNPERFALFLLNNPDVKDRQRTFKNHKIFFSDEDYTRFKNNNMVWAEQILKKLRVMHV